MKFYGLQKTTLLDYPGHVAATIFTGGCNFRCPFCHNMDIVDFSANSQIQSINEDEILRFLEKRSSVLEGICITGGEPTLNEDLEQFINKVKNIKTDGKPLLVKLDTNGTNPELLDKLINKGLIDYVAMDIKSSEDMYHVAAGISKDSSLIISIKKSINIIINSGIDYEFRTTVVDGIHDEESIKGVGKLIKGAKTHYLQLFKESEFVVDKSLTTPDKDKICNYSDILKEYVNKAYIRGVD